MSVRECGECHALVAMECANCGVKLRQLRYELVVDFIPVPGSALCVVCHVERLIA